MERLNTPFDIPPLAFSGAVRSEATHETMLRVTTVELPYDQRFGIARSVFQQAL